MGSGYYSQISTGSDYSVLIGGNDNFIQTDSDYAFIGSGRANRVDGNYSIVIGGYSNGMEDASDYSFIGGGKNNEISSSKLSDALDYNFIGGGANNEISASYASIPGGIYNEIREDCDYSFAAGARALVQHPGCFVWSDSSTAISFKSEKSYEFAARAKGGVRFVTATGNGGVPTAGAILPSGGGAWLALSDRESKENVDRVDSQEVLRKVATMPISTWNYKTQDDAVRHIGPMAQDFHAAFGVGESEKHISTVDIDGVALAAIQGLNEKVEELEGIVREKDEKLNSQSVQIKALLEKLESLDAVVEQMKGHSFE